jgi:acyl-CoA synthetase (AMP-forming)/AMP-acid ligase II
VPAVTFEATCPSELLEHRALIDPDGACWRFEDRTWTWAEAWHASRRLAGALRAAGIGRGDRLALLDSLSPTTITAMHAACLIGAADVVIDSRLSGDEIAYILRNSGARVLLVGHQLASVVAGIADRLDGLRVVVMGGAADELDAWLDEGEPIGLQPDVTTHDPCLVLYSSGTTGRPKGIVLTQHNLLAHTRHAFGDVEHDPGDVMLIATVMFHSCALFAAAAGIPGIVSPDLSVGRLVQAMDAGLTHAYLTPTSILRLQAAGPATMARLATLTSVAYGAAPMPLPVLRSVMSAWPRTSFRQVYGMTELVSVVTVLDDAAHRDADHPELLQSCGRPIRGVELRVVDPDTGVDVAPGLLGELWFRSEQSTPGYLGDPAATAELIVQDGWVRSGDLGRVDDDGFVYIEDRLKDLVLINGYNVFPAEVERVLVEHPDVQETAVIGVPDDALGESVKAFVVLHPGVTTTPGELIAFCRTRIAPYKTPQTVDVVNELPHNALGKILKRELREPFWADRPRKV